MNLRDVTEEYHPVCPNCKRILTICNYDPKMYPNKIVDNLLYCGYCKRLYREEKE